MEWIPTAIAALAALAAFWQANEARRANKGARDAEEKAVNASTRSATALEEMNERQREAAGQYQSPWRFREDTGPSGTRRLRVEYVANHDALDVVWKVGPEPFALTPADDEPSAVSRGWANQYTWSRDFSSAPTASLTVSWEHATTPKERLSETFTLTG